MKKYILVVLLAFSSFAQAQVIETDRPDQTEASSIIPKYSFQIETGFSVMYSRDDTNRIRQFVLPTNLLRIGILKWLELRFVGSIETYKVESGNYSERFAGIADSEIGVKVQLFRKKNVGTEIAFITHLSLPIGTERLTASRFGTINKLSISHNICDNFGFGYNIGYNYFGIGKGALIYTLAFGFSITDKLGVYIEPFGEWVNFDTPTLNIDGGITYLIKKNLQADLSYGTGVLSRMNYVALGISWNVSRKKATKD